MSNSLIIAPVSWHTEQAALSSIRECVFMQEQQVSAEDEWDGKDETAIHFLVKDHTQKALGCARLLVEIQGEQSVFHIGRVAVLKEYRNQGIGSKLMNYIIHYCKIHGFENPIYLHAQIVRQAFYEHLGFIAQGNVFMDAGIEHIEMWHKG